MKQLNPKYVWQYFIRVFFSLVFTSILPAAFILLNVDIYGITDSYKSIGYWQALGIIFFLLIPVTWVWTKLTYRFYKYEFREEGFRKESGVIFKKYHTIPYGRIQNVDIYRGISDRILGLSHILIQTAGSSNLHFQEGRLPGLSVKVAEKLRDELIQRANRMKSSSGV